MADLNLNDLAVFARVVEHGGFASAARELGCPTSTVSRTILRLESMTGLRLLHRTTRIVRPTIEGRELYASVAAAVTTLQRAARAIEPATRKPKGRLRVTAPNDLCATFLADVIVAFVDRYPLVQLDFVLTNRSANIVEEGFDVAVRAAVKLGDSSLIARKLGQLELRLYASPEYLEKHGTPASVADLQDHRCIVFRAEELEKIWPLRSAGGDARVSVRGRVGGDDFTFVRAVILAGGGIGLLPHFNSAKEEASGRLVRVLPEVSMPGATLYILYPSARNLPARVSAFRDFVVEAFDAWLARSAEADDAREKARGPRASG
jgi:DNA-binding transcriptional LysR family regulator